MDFGELDDDWENFIQNNNACLDESSISNLIDNSEKSTLDQSNEIPKASDIYISTKTKICYLNIDNIDIQEVFWNIPIIPYHKAQDGIIKKQIKFATTKREELEKVKEHLSQINFYDEHVIEHIDNPNGRVKFKDQRKISIGISKKDILSYRSKKKRAFFNCFVLILRIYHDNEYKEMHTKIFNTGKIEIPGIQEETMMQKVIDLLLKTIQPFITQNLICMDNIETVLINSNFNCGYYINRDKLHDILKYKYRINSNYDACSYPGIQCKFYYDEEVETQNGQQINNGTSTSCYQISFMIFRTGSVLIVGKCNENILMEIYLFIKKMLEDEYLEIRENIKMEVKSKVKQTKLRKRTLILQN